MRGFILDQDKPRLHEASRAGPTVVVLGDEGTVGHDLGRVWAKGDGERPLVWGVRVRMVLLGVPGQVLQFHPPAADHAHLMVDLRPASDIHKAL